MDILNSVIIKEQEEEEEQQKQVINEYTFNKICQSNQPDDRINQIVEKQDLSQLNFNPLRIIIISGRFLCVQNLLTKLHESKNQHTIVNKACVKVALQCGFVEILLLLLSKVPSLFQVCKFLNTLCVSSVCVCSSDVVLFCGIVVLVRKLNCA